MSVWQWTGAAAAFPLLGYPLFLWVYWRLIFWKNHPETRLNTVAVPLTVGLLLIAGMLS